jgi:hypothetical protein
MGSSEETPSNKRPPPQYFMKGECNDELYVIGAISSSSHLEIHL